MILQISVSNFLVFRKKTSLSFLASSKKERFASNALPFGKKSLLKSVCLYGPNNVGKSCLIRAFAFLKDALAGHALPSVANLDLLEEPTQLSVDFLIQEKAYRFAFSYESKTSRFLFERLSSLEKGNAETVIYEAQDSGKKLSGLENPKAKAILSALGDSLEIVASASLSSAKTAQAMADDPRLREKIVAFLKAADVGIGGFAYEKEGKSLTTVYGGKPVSSSSYDSLGTQKLEALSSYVITSLAEGKTLVVDELDSSLHYKLTRAIVSLFNNLANTKGQLLFSTQDITLLDTESLFRADQIWLIDKGARGPRLYPLSKVAGEGEDALERYVHGEFGALPSPHLIDTLLTIATEGHAAKGK